MSKKIYKVGFYNQHGRCYFFQECKHVDITTAQTIIYFSDSENNNEGTIFRSVDEVESLIIKHSQIVITYISGQRIVIDIC